MVPEEWAHKIYDILVETCGASDREGSHTRDSFIFHQGEGCREYRFGGVFGFGGKFWDDAGRWYVNYYQEQATPQLDEIVAIQKAANEKLAALREEFLRSLN